MSESVWEFLDVMLEMSEEAKQNGRAMDKRIVGECLARNMKEPVLGLKLLGRIEQRPDDSLDEWVEWIATKENDWKLMNSGKGKAEINEKRVEGKTDGTDIKAAQEKLAGGEGRYNGACFRCGSNDHFIARCPEFRNRYSMQQNSGYQGVRNRDSRQQDNGQGTQVHETRAFGQRAEN